MAVGWDRTGSALRGLWVLLLGDCFQIAALGVAELAEVWDLAVLQCRNQRTLARSSQGSAPRVPLRLPQHCVGSAQAVELGLHLWGLVLKLRCSRWS